MIQEQEKFDVVAAAATLLLTATEERELAKRVVAGDKEARDRLILANLRLVQGMTTRFLICHQHRNSLINEDDLFQEGIKGLMHAVQKFDYTKGYRFSTYATAWIRQALNRYYLECGYSVAIPDYQGAYLAALRRARAELMHEKTEPNAENLYERMQQYQLRPVKLTLDLVESLLVWIHPADSLARPISTGESEEIDLGTILPDPGDDYARLDEQLAVQDLLTVLSPRERTIVEQHYGVGSCAGDDTVVLKKIGKRMKITGEAVRLQEEKAMEKLRAVLV